jgi:hypothetical protein
MLARAEYIIYGRHPFKLCILTHVICTEGHDTSPLGNCCERSGSGQAYDQEGKLGALQAANKSEPHAELLLLDCITYCVVHIWETLA